MMHRHSVSSQVMQYEQLRNYIHIGWFYTFIAHTLTLTCPKLPFVYIVESKSCIKATIEHKEKKTTLSLKVILGFAELFNIDILVWL